MLFKKTDPRGIDVTIGRLQDRLHSGIIKALSLSDSDYHCHGRCYRNRKDGGYAAEVFTGGNDYKDVYWDDTLKALSFFGKSDKVEEQTGQNICDVHLVFFGNLSKLFPSLSHRGDEELRITVQDLLPQLQVQSVETGVENVLREYPISRDALRDMQPLHFFRINVKLIYSNQDC